MYLSPLCLKAVGKCENVELLFKHTDNSSCIPLHHILKLKAKTHYNFHLESQSPFPDLHPHCSDIEKEKPFIIEPIWCLFVCCLV